MEADGPAVAGRGPDGAGVVHPVGVLIEQRRRGLKLLVGAAIGGRRRDGDLAAVLEPVGVSRADRAGPFRRVLEVPRVRHVHEATDQGRAGRVQRAGRDVGEELVELGVDVADHAVDHEVFGRTQRALELPTADRGRTDVVDHRGDGRAGRILGRDLLVLVRGVEDGGGEAEAIEQRALQTDLDGLDGFRIIAIDGVRIEHRVAAHVEAARLEAATPRGIGRQVRGDLVREADPRGELLEVTGAGVVRARQAERHSRRVSEERAADAEVLLAEDRAGLLVAGEATADGQRKLVGEVVGQVTEDRPALGVDAARGERGQVRQAHDGVEGARGRGVHVEDTGDRRPVVAVQQRLEFLAELVVVILGRDVQDRRRQVVEVDVPARFAVAIGGDRLERQHVVDDVLAGQRDAARLHVVPVAGAGAGVVLAGQDRSELAVTVAGVGAVLHPVGGDTEEQRVRRRPFHAGAGGGDVLVVVLGAGVQVGAEAVTQVAGDAEGDADRVADRAGDIGDGVELVVAAVGALQRDRGLIADAAGHILDRAADGVAAVQGALRPAQDLDALHVEDIQDRGLRTGDIDVVDVQTHARIEAPQRVLLANAADEGDQGRVRAARRVQRQTGRRTGQFGDVGRALVLERLGRDGGDRHRHVLQRFRATAGGHDDLAQRGGFLAFRGRLGVLRERHARQGGPGGPCEQGGFHESVHGSPRS